VTAGRSYLRDLRDFLRFLQSLWGILAGVSLLFPLSNVFFDVLPIHEKYRPFHNLSAPALTAVTVVTCLFITFATFGRRQEFRDATRRRRFGRAARACFLLAVANCAVFLLGRDLAIDNVIVLGQEDQPPALLFDGVFAIVYVAFFALMTRAFLLLAMLEYFPATQESPIVTSNES
jgi:hypothetical protein